MAKLLLPFFLLLSLFSNSQSTSPRLKVFLDCTQGWLCDYDYVRTELGVVDFVRDRFGSDVHVLVNTQRSSSGGVQAQLNFIGLGSYAHLSDTLTYFNNPTLTEDEQRKKMVQYLKIGLLRYLSKSGGADLASITFGKGDSSTTKQTPTKDKWNYWVFQVSAYGSLNGDQNSRSRYTNGSFSADRETEDIKINFNLSFDQSLDVYKQNRVESRFDQKSHEASFDIAKSINPHWSYGLSTEYENSLFSNLQAAYELRPKVEYSFFPYTQFNSQRIVAQYLVGPRHFRYYDTTVFFKTSEWQVQQGLNLIASFTKPWGNINVGVFYSSLFSDFSKNNLAFNGAVSWRIVKGLNFALWGGYTIIHDQINLRKGQATRDQLLVRNRELSTAYRYNIGVGVSYRFGSLLNSIVNPRFRGLNYSINF